MRLRRCHHEHTRCTHGDEIIARRYRRIVCLDCGRALAGPLPDVCYETGRPHESASAERDRLAGWDPATSTYLKGGIAARNTSRPELHAVPSPPRHSGLKGAFLGHGPVPERAPTRPWPEWDEVAGVEPIVLPTMTFISVSDGITSIPHAVVIRHDGSRLDVPTIRTLHGWSVDLRDIELLPGETIWIGPAGVQPPA